jgi:cardiolipin synthase
VARDLGAALAERCRAGVGVNVLLDAEGTRAMPASHLDLLRASGCHVALFPPSGADGGGRRNHRRILVVDGRVGFTGSSGVSRWWMGNGRLSGHWRDTDVRVTGPVVEQLQAAFAESWLAATGMGLGGPAYFPRPREARGQVYAHVVRSSPAAGTRTLYTTLLLAVASARRSISITTPALSPDEPLAGALRAAAARGVRVRALVPGDGEPETVAFPARGLDALQEGGMEIYAYAPARLHARTVVIDGVWATVGSLTLDHRNFGQHDEVNLVIYNAGVASRLEHAFREDLRHAQPLEDVGRRRPAGPRATAPGPS